MQSTNVLLRQMLGSVPANYLRELAKRIDGQNTSSVNSAGADVFLLAGQSNSEGAGLGIDANLDYSDSNILQYCGAGAYEKKLILATEPLIHRGGGSANRIGMHLTFAKLYKQVTGRRVILVPCALGGTSFVANRWNPENDLFEYAITNTLEVLAIDSNNVLKALLWHQGESDTGSTPLAFKNALDNAIVAFRTRLNSPNLPFILGEFVPDWLAANLPLTPFNDVLKDTPNRISNTYFVSAKDLSGIPNDIIHYSANSLREYGKRYFATYYSNILSKVPPAAIKFLSSSNITQNSVNLTWIADYFTNNFQITNNQDSTVINTNFTNVVITGLLPNTNYTFSVFATNKNGISPLTNITIKTNQIPAVTVPTPTYQYLLNGNVNNTGTNTTAPVNSNVTFVNNSQRGQVGQFSSNGQTINYLACNVPLTANHTKAVWAYSLGTMANGYANLITLISGTASQDHALWVPDPFRLSAGFKDGSNSIDPYKNIQDSVAFPLNQWVHVAATMNNGVLKLFKNGVLVGTANTVFTGSPNILIGTAYEPGDNLGTWFGLMSKVQIWNNALTDAQIQAIYNQG